MVRNFKLSMVLVLAFFVAASSVWAGRGFGAGDGTGPMIDLYSGTPETVTGVVVELPAPGNPGLKIDTGESIVTVYGLGPQWFWEKSGQAYPQIGENITVEGYEVTMSDGTSRLIATKVILSGQEISLRDDSGRPVWRGGLNAKRANQAQ